MNGIVNKRDALAATVGKAEVRLLYAEKTFEYAKPDLSVSYIHDFIDALRNISRVVYMTGRSCVEPVRDYVALHRVRSDLRRSHRDIDKLIAMTEKLSKAFPRSIADNPYDRLLPVLTGLEAICTKIDIESTMIIDIVSAERSLLQRVVDVIRRWV